MSSLYKNLSEDDLKIEKESLKNLEKKLSATSNVSALKAAVIGAFAMSVISLIGSAYLYQSLNKEKRQREALEASQIQIREKAAAFEQDYEKNKAEVTKLSEQVKTYSAQRQEITQQLAQSRKEVAALQNKIKEIEAQSAALEAAEPAIIGPMLPETETPVTTPAAKAPAAPAQKSAPVTAAAPAEPSTIKTPQVLSVNRKFNFIVTNVGLKANLELNDVLEIERGGKVIGKATVEKVYDNFAAATITQETKEAPIQQGDTIRKT